MNIFALHPNPAIAASMHCDQHLHKMILESAQMLSTMFHYTFPEETRIRALIYKSVYKNHPCTSWILNDIRNSAWLIRLAYELQDIRYTLGAEEHSSLQIIKAIDNVIDSEFWLIKTPNYPSSFQFCGPLQFSLRPDLSIHQKYQAYYKQKYRLWLDTAHPMSYKGRPLPGFLAEFASSIPHNGIILPEPTES